MNVSLIGLLEFFRLPIVLVAVLAVFYVIWLVITTQLSPLNAIPGPRWAKYTRYWLLRTLTTGYAQDTLLELNRKYGPLVRIGPNHLLTDDPVFVRRMLGPRTTYTRGPWFDCFKIHPYDTNLASERDRQKHNLLRSKVAPGMAGRGMEWESIVSERVSDWADRLDKDWTSTAQATKVLDIAKTIEYLGLDIMTHLCFGNPLGFVETNTDLYGYLQMFHEKIPLATYMSILLELNTLKDLIACIPWLFDKLVPAADDAEGFGKLMGITKNFVEQRLKPHADRQNDMLGSFLEHGTSPTVAQRELMTFIFAGSDTTATATQATLLAIISNPVIYQTLQKEIDQAVSESTASSPIKFSQSTNLPYLRACVMEGLRIFPPTAELSERMTPPEGDTIQGYKIPGGVFIGLNVRGIQRNKVYGEDVDIYRPDRWLEVDKEHLREMSKTLDLVFGYGETKCLGYNLAQMTIFRIIFEACLGDRCTSSKVRRGDNESCKTVGQ
ncbi:hypothetical protein MMC11_002055 [Xylographa trunciseda]|nr:hypothetical protein [Xylographa trunciseda]